MTNQETEALLLELLYCMCGTFKVEMPCPRCGRYSKKGLNHDSIVADYWNICPECAKKEPVDKLPFAEWALKNGGITMELIQDKAEEIEAKIDEKKAEINWEYKRRRRRWDVIMTCLILAVVLMEIARFLWG